MGNEDLLAGVVAIDETVSVLHIKRLDGATHSFICLFSELLAQLGELLLQHVDWFLRLVLQLEPVNLLCVLHLVWVWTWPWVGHRCNISWLTLVVMNAGARSDVKCNFNGRRPPPWPLPHYAANSYTQTWPPGPTKNERQFGSRADTRSKCNLLQVINYF